MLAHEWGRQAVTWTGRGRLGGDGVRQEEVRETRRAVASSSEERRALKCGRARRAVVRRALRSGDVKAWQRSAAVWSKSAEQLSN